jgi:hypothetical protein
MEVRIPLSKTKAIMPAALIVPPQALPSNWADEMKDMAHAMDHLQQEMTLLGLQQQ